MSEQAVVRRYRNRSVVKGPELYLRVPDALELIEDCKREDLATLGVEGFLFDSGTLTPQMDLIADYSSKEEFSNWAEYRESVNAAALDFVRGMTPMGDIVVSIEVWSEEEWSAAN